METGNPDDREPELPRQTELQTASEHNKSIGKPLYSGVQIRTLGELRWIMQKQRWLGAADTTPGLRAQLSGANFAETDLSGVDLYGADLRNADLHGTKLVGANLQWADCSGANLRDADLRGTFLRSAILRATHLDRADLRGAYLRYARLDEDTDLDDANIDKTTLIGDVRWNGANLSQVDWDNVPVLGDEQRIYAEKDRKERIQRLRDVARGYNKLMLALKSQGLLATASRFRLREQRLLRWALRLENKFLSWAASVILDVIAGYGERPIRTFEAYVIALTTFTLAYLGIAHFHDPRLLRLPWWEWAALSVTAFHGRGFFPGTLPAPPSGWITLVALIESVVGLFIELVFIATFTRRFLTN